VCSGSLGRVGKGRAKALGALWAQVVDRGGEEATAPQRARDCARQQARPHRLGGSQQGARLRVRQERCDGVQARLILAPSSEPSRRRRATLSRGARRVRRGGLTAVARGASLPVQAGTKERLPGANKGTARKQESTMS